MAAERVRLRIGNLAKAVLVTGQAYQDPKDALNEFVSNAADEYLETGRRGGRIRIILRRKGRSPVITVQDEGRGLSPDRLREVARNLFESSKAGDSRTLGEKAIGLLAFQQLGVRCDVVSRAEGSDETWTLHLERGKAVAELDRERRRARAFPGTAVYIYDLDPDVLRLLTQRKVVDYLRVRRAAALTRGDYSIEVVEGRDVELVTPMRPDGVRLALPHRRTPLGPVELLLHVAAPDGRRRRVQVVGRAGTTIIDDVSELEELAEGPWASDQVSGQIVYEALQQSAGRRAVLRDRDAFPYFVEAVRSITPIVAAAVDQVAREVDAATAERVSETIRRIFGRVLKELADLDNPMRTNVAGGEDPTTPADLEDTLALIPAPPGPPDWPEPFPADQQAFTPLPAPDADRPDRLPPPPPLMPGDPLPAPRRTARADRRKVAHLPSVEVDPSPGQDRSRFDAERGVVLYNDRHGDYLLVKDDEAALLDYLATLVAKEYVLYNNTAAAPTDLTEEMVRVLVRVRRHLPRRR
jgi:hypothetical protein